MSLIALKYYASAADKHVYFFGNVSYFKLNLEVFVILKGKQKKYYRYLKASSSWIVGRKKFLIDFIDSCRVLYVIEQHSSFHYIVVGTAGSFQNSSHVSQGLRSLGFNSSSNNLHCFGIKTNTTRNVQCFIHQYSLKQLIIRILIINVPNFNYWNQSSCQCQDPLGKCQAVTKQ